MLERLCCPVDVYMLLERDGRLLLLRRVKDAAYAPLLLCPPSGHVEQGEDVATAVIRETAEETGIRLRRDGVRCVTVVQNRVPGGQALIGGFFAAAPGWAGEPVNREPTKHSELVWADRPRLRRIWWQIPGRGWRPSGPGAEGGVLAAGGEPGAL
jgi:8-oxo-dGTP diphosphatase